MLKCLALIIFTCFWFFNANIGNNIVTRALISARCSFILMFIQSVSSDHCSTVFLELVCYYGKAAKLN